jgi:hypothetical protein
MQSWQNSWARRVRGDLLAVRARRLMYEPEDRRGVVSKNCRSWRCLQALAGLTNSLSATGAGEDRRLLIALFAGVADNSVDKESSRPGVDVRIQHFVNFLRC